MEKVVDVIDLYHNPPERAVVLCVDEKSPVQALNRSQPVLPIMRFTIAYARRKSAAALYGERLTRHTS